MKKFVFVLATVSQEGESPSPEDISFRHAIVEAETESDAYAEGYSAVGCPVAEGNETMNDYVVEIP